MQKNDQEFDAFEIAKKIVRPNEDIIIELYIGNDGVGSQ